MMNILCVFLDIQIFLYVIRDGFILSIRRM